MRTDGITGRISLQFPTRSLSDRHLTLAICARGLDASYRVQWLYIFVQQLEDLQ